MFRNKFFSFQTIALLLLSTLLTAFAPLNTAQAAQNLVFLAKADAYVSAQAPATNFGTLPSLQVDAQPVERSYLRFQVSGLNGRRINSAIVRIYAASSSSQGLTLAPVANTTWGETAITFNNAPALGTVLKWTVPTVAAGSWVSFNVSNYVKGEGLFSFGLTTPGPTRISLASRESVTFIPRLVLNVGIPDPVLVGAGDIADCGSSGDEATAKLVAGIPGTVFTAGDNAYDDGTPAEFANCYHPSWGRFKARTRPSPGNHDYYTSGAAGYYGYFGAAAGGPLKGYYSYNLGTWHIIVLNSEIDAAAGSPQEKWLRQDLAANPRLCTLAYWHKPLFSSGSSHGSNPEFKALWQALYNAHAEVVINGHEHNYERFAPQTPAGVADPKGLREFVVGTGGKNHYGFSTPLPNSVVRHTGTFGVIKFTLHPGSYDWKFIPVAGKTFTDSGTAKCNP